MSLRKRTFLNVAIVLLASMVIAYFVVWRSLSSQFDRFEEGIVLRNIDRTTRMLDDELTSLAGIAQDWGAWDDTYAFIENHNQDYIDKNLVPEPLSNLHMGFIALLNTSREVVVSRLLDLETKAETPPDAEFLKWIKTLCAPDESAIRAMKGWSTSPRGVALVATNPILTSSLGGPSRGIIVVGYLLTPQETARLERLTLISMEFVSFDAKNPTADVEKAKTALAGTGSHVAKPLDSHLIAGYAALNDLQGRPSVLLRIEMEREARGFRDRAWAFVIFSIVAIGLTVTTFAMAVLDKMVLMRILALSRKLSYIAAHGDPSGRVEVLGRNDELTRLAEEINATLEALERSREDLRASEAVARTLLDAPGNPAVLLDPDGRILGLNRGAAVFLRDRDLKHQSGIDSECTTDDICHERINEIRQAVETRKPVTCEEEADGRYLVHSLYPVLNKDGEVVQVALFTRDVTEQRQAASSLRESEQRYRSFVENSHGVIFQARRDGVLVLCHGNVEEITHYSEADIVEGGIQWRSIVHPDDLEAFDRVWNRLITYPGATSQQRYRLLRRDGHLRWVEAFARSLPGQNGKAHCVQGVLYDITERVADEQALRESLQTTADIVRAIPSGLLTFRYRSPDSFVLLDSNLEGERLTGLSLEECRGREFKDLWPGSGAGLAIRMFKRVMRTGRVHETEDFHHRNENTQWAFRVRAFPLPGDKLAVAFEDILGRRQAEAERKRLEEQLHHSQKMEAIGQLAGGVAHDFNNLLGGILGYASLLRLEAGTSKTVLEAAQTIEQAAERAADLTRQLLGFARRGKFQNVVVDLHDTVKEVVHLLDRTLGKNIRIVQHLDATNGNVMGDPNQLQQVFVNLALNARDAMPNGGELTFESSLVERQGLIPEFFPECQGRQYLLVTVKDQGCGIAKDHLDRVFEPFFTTKEQGKGTGMGLAMVYGIVKNHGGSVRVHSQLGVGTTFQVFLPAAPVTPTVETASPVAEKPLTGTANILLVDDEAIIRNMGSTVLSRLGYSVVTVPGGREALEYYRGCAQKIDLVILDMVMPEMSGHDCFRALRCVNPGIRALLSSGYGFNGKASELLEEGMLGFIQKPYRVTELSVAVARALEGQSV